MNKKYLRLVGLLVASSFVAAHARAADIRFTRMGPDLDDRYRAGNATVAFNASDDEFLIAWQGTDDTPPLVIFEQEIFVQRVASQTGDLLTESPVRVSFMGPNGNPNYLAHDPVIAWNPDRNEYLIVWWADDNTGALVDDEREIYAQRLSSTAALLGDRVRVSFMGQDGDALAEALSPQVVYNGTQGEYYIVWGGDSIDEINQVNQDYEIFGQRLNADDLTPIGPNRRLSDMGESDANASFTAADASVTFNTADNEYLVVWEGDDDAGETVDGEQEVYGQRIDASTGLEVGTNDFRISFQGPKGATDYDSTNGAVAYNALVNEYLVVWNGSDDVDGTVRNDLEIYAQRLSTIGTPVGTNQLRISSMGTDGSTAWWAEGPRVLIDPASGGYLVTWRGEDNTGALVNNEYEAYAQRLSATLTSLGPRIRMSRMGSDGDTAYDAGSVSVALDSLSNEFLVVHGSNDDRPDLARLEREIFGRFLRTDSVFVGGFE